MGDGPHLARPLGEVADDAGIKRNVTPHTLRRTCATHLLKTGDRDPVRQRLEAREARGGLAAILMGVDVD